MFESSDPELTHYTPVQVVGLTCVGDTPGNCVMCAWVVMLIYPGTADLAWTIGPATYAKDE